MLSGRALLVVAAILICPPPASALTNMQPAGYGPTDALFRDAIASADAWWFNTARRAPADVRLYLYDGADKVAYGYPGTGNIYVWREYRNFVWTNRRNIYILAGAWAVMAHERGHNLGLMHVTYLNIMRSPPTIPSRAFKWALQFRRSNV